MTKLDFSKPDQLQIRDGSEFRIYATDHCGIYPVIGAVKGTSGWHYQLWDYRGHVPACNTEHPLDLVRKPARIKGWVNVYQQPSGVYTTSNVFESQIEARKASSCGCFGQIYIDAEVQE